jgi:hypothetical protein
MATSQRKTYNKVSNCEQTLSPIMPEGSHLAGIANGESASLTGHR